MKKTEKKLVPPGTEVMLSGVNTTTGPVTIIRYLPDHRVLVRDDRSGSSFLYDVKISRVIVPGARIRQ